MTIFSEQAPNRALILDDVRTWLGTITVANGWPLNVVTVGDKLRQADEMALEELPWAGVYAAPGQPAPRYFPFGRTEEVFEFLVVAHVRGGDQAEKEEMVALLESAIESVLQRDPTRDSFSIDTIRTGAPNSDEAQPDKGGRVDRVTDIEIRYRCSFFPGDDGGQRVAHGEIRRDGAATVTSIGVPPLSFWTHLEGDTELGSAVLFEQSADGTLKYVGVKPRTMLVSLAGSVYGSAAQEVFLGVRKSATITDGIVGLGLDGTTNEVAIALQVIVDLVENDTLDLAVFSAGAVDVYWVNGSLSAIPVSRY